MKNTIRIVLVLCLLGMLSFLAGCQKSRSFQTTFPLEESEVTNLLEQAGLPGEISGEETESRQKGHISYVIRDDSETYADSGNSKFIANIVSLERKDGRVLSTVFAQSDATETPVWEDWERQIRLAALLYGGFEEESSLYNACLEAQRQDVSSSVWNIELEEGFCRVTYAAQTSKTYDANGFEVQNGTGILGVNIYESKSLYEKMKDEQQAASHG